MNQEIKIGFEALKEMKIIDVLKIESDFLKEVDSKRVKNEE